LQHDLDYAESMRIKAEDDARVWRSRCDWAEEDLKKARAELTTALKQQSNWQAMMTGAPHVPFPDVQAPPPTPEPVVNSNGAPLSIRSGSMRDLQRTAVLKSRMAAYERARAARNATETTE
jgi:hypothetical protein